MKEGVGINENQKRETKERIMTFDTDRWKDESRYLKDTWNQGGNSTIVGNSQSSQHM